MGEYIHEILVLAKRKERRENLRFLLHLSRYQAISITDDREAFNYLVQRQNGLAPVSLLLIDEAELRQPFFNLLPKLEEQQVALPILLTYREAPLLLDPLRCSPLQRTMISQCRTSLIHAGIREALASYQENSRAC